LSRSPNLVLDADHRDVLHALVLGERLLDLLGVDVLTARHDHVVGAALDEQAPLLVEVAEVARGHVAVHDLLALAARVALEQHRVAHVHHSRLHRDDRADGDRRGA
jgi:hypothetical protein